MINFNKIQYKRLEYETEKEKIENLISNLKNSNSYSSVLNYCKQIIFIQNVIEEMCDYADIRNMRDSSDQFYIDEINYWNKFKPKFDLLFIPFYSIINDSPYKEKLKKVMPDNFFNSISYKLKTSSLGIVELLAQENILKSKYRKLNQTKINYDGEEKNISYISGLFSNSNRSIRKQAHDDLNDFYYSKQKEYDEIMFELINIRNKIAKKSEFNHYVEYSLYELKRFGYNYNDIKKFRENIKKFIVPLCNTISNWKKEELGIDELQYYDTIYFTNMPIAIFTGKELLDKLSVAFEQTNRDLSTLYAEMLKNEYIDLEQRENEVNFAITNYLTKSCMPVITGNFKNNYLDIKTVTHEMGHAFQKYCASKKDKGLIVSSILKYPTFEIAEMFSYAMELIMMDHIDFLFTENDYNKYCFMEIYNLVTTLPYICLVDEFQEKVYSKENLKMEDIRKIWLDISKEYKLDKLYDGHINLSSGGYFYRQSHIYLNPFYYIDYALSYFGAFAIWEHCSSNLDLFKEIGAVASYYPFDYIIQKYHMTNPFDENSVKKMAKHLENELNKRRVKMK
ncbi:MAG: M3 family metallopeptidase [Erysipelotrichaceae bacterium]|nr:M3 family metallopeptidase [Erysipelotrichaceae bacterium]